MDSIFELEKPLADLINSLTKQLEQTNDKVIEKKLEDFVQRRIELYQMLPKSRAEAVARGQTHYFDSKGVVNG